jgi:hypothetical protein
MNVRSRHRRPGEVGRLQATRVGPQDAKKTLAGQFFAGLVGFVARSHAFAQL